jgi:endonuclease-3
MGAILQALRMAYPDAHCELHFTNPLELLIATILSAQCSDQQVNRVTPALFAKYPSANHYAQASLDELEQDLRRIGLFRNKARNIRSCCQRLVEQFDGQVPDRMEDLTGLDGVGRKTANVVLGNAFGKVTGIVVDTHVGRLARRLRLSASDQPVQVEKDLCRLLPESEWIWISHGLIWHGRRRCQARKPDCARCELQSLCPSASCTG